ncbi:Arsenate reductase [Rhodovulum sp. P5]|uniref:arsenate reductase (glutaredoxin) n=1 Tax=Rhodovulum sp. P5 TaxID=1564506 RepID=UPI0009C3ADAA|nr:arsenate reductase (glutaredoxin) [Rhodovulum sp. P5]ARE38864.1 Arsenate reductase [Rhodovulum sp. P5]
MTEVVIWHNPRCSKSREALKLIEGRGITPVIRRYLDDPPSLEELRATQGTLGLRAIEMMRVKETLFRDLGLSKDDDDETLLAAMAANPKLIERAIVFANGRAVLGRPPELVLDIL